MIKLGIEHLVSINALILPYGLFPGSYPGGNDEKIFESKEAWDAYVWNPPQYSGLEGDPDPRASSKPEWEELEVVGMLEHLSQARTDKLRLLKSECEIRITRAYGEMNTRDELFLRLRGGQTAKQDAERERLRAKYIEIKTTIQNASLKQLQSLDLNADGLWAP